jgi:hypothetical protein
MILSDFSGEYMCFHIDPAITFDEDEGSPYIALRTDYYYQLEYEYSDIYYGKIESQRFEYSGHISSHWGPCLFDLVKSPLNGVSVVWNYGQDIYLWRERLTGVTEQIAPGLPIKALLSSAHPNPFNSSVVISYSLPSPRQVRLEIFDPLGREVAALVNGRQLPGQKEILWDASDMTSGLYFYKLTAGEFSEVKKITLLK